MSISFVPINGDNPHRSAKAHHLKGSGNKEMALAGKTLIILVATSVLGSVGAAVGTGWLLRSKQTSATALEHAGKREPEVRIPLTIHPLGDMVINLADVPTESLRYAKVLIAVGYEEKVEPTEMKTYEPILRDAVIRLISKKRFSDLRKPNGLDTLKEELMKDMDKLIPKLHLCNVYLENFAMQ
ncbi:MAG: flagellar basal body-associated FliL family protein [Armatimonadetes bacterium]|nr:flagellar basal body-associated FliL family protein [Armatimonadota bacterium]